MLDNTERGGSFGAASTKVSSCGLSKRKSSRNFETRSNRTRVYINFFHCSCAPCSFQKWVVL